ncbi:MAG: DUF2950 domain-containing protein [Nitrospirae bacterium]|nr:DUF2950 domain-containing protein [Nitrospirota bacterium]MCL5422833.1 DUF2950 domain-containing protein [Nitrospirota bacterium]
MAVQSCVIAAAILFLGASSDSFAVGKQQKSFSSPEEAVKSLVAAVRANDEKEMLAILGPGSKELIYSGDEVADKAGREKFINAYDQMNTLEKESENTMVLHIGPDNWSMPIPIVKKGTAWVFDIRKGKNEILNRRIGRNELHVIEVLHAYVEAQHEYATKDCGGGGKVEFARKFISTEGKRDGLYWEAKEGEEESPLGPLIARAAKEGYAKASNLSPFHGYYFKILKGQGKHAEGGAYNYIVKGRMILGFALAAYPAEYGNSGVMTFMVNQEGTIYEKNLGKDTRRIAEAMKVFNPDKTWKKTEEKVEQQ